MKKRQLGSSDLYLSELGLGCMSLGTDEQKARAIVERAVEAGINYLDTADLYDLGKNEEIVGKVVKGMRDKVFIGTKVGNHFNVEDGSWFWDPSKAYIKEEIKESLRRLGLDYIDLYQLHGGTMEDPIGETISAFEELKQEGLIREYGISSIRPNVIREYVKHSNIVSVMTQYSLFDRRPEEETLNLLKENNIGVLARGPMAKGMLSHNASSIVKEKGKDGYLSYTFKELSEMVGEIEKNAGESRPIEALALQYILHHDSVTTAVFGASSVQQLEKNLQYMDAPELTDDQYETLQSITKPITYDKHR
ncbi:aldo/keto reductase [Aquibacillus sp. 3ASR75-11]|uniref:Aldo/keto reductase n=1 Tax=Terrihalobacillus insolitus TaxID=2950438 RepID=A0A9X3WWU6_9BACI|nr:aldo/keto reductase [Terrihalobacillus insolitus]MDC3413117.1 aldo/keto reductase [Terrihalobacillus insolitus]MDC3424859.1 aldo/keto reductase [Terrihalobacillus insolitus]